MKRKGKNGRGPSIPQPQTFSGVAETESTGNPTSRNLIVEKEAFSPSSTQAEMAPLDRESLKQINHFVRGHTFIQISLSGHTTSQRRAFERDVYDYARGLGLPRPEARREVLKARGFCGEFDYDSDVSMLGDEVNDSAQLLAGLSSRPNVSQSRPPNISTSQLEPIPTPKHRKQSYQKNPMVSITHPGTSSGSLSAEAVAAIPGGNSSKATRKSRKRKPTELDEDPNPADFATPHGKPGRRKSKKPKDKSSASLDVTPDMQQGDTKPVSHKHSAKRQKLEPRLDRLDTAEDSAHGDGEQQPNAGTSAMEMKQKKERRNKKVKEGKKGEKAANSEAANGEVSVPYENEERFSKEELKAARSENQRRENDAKEGKRVTKAERMGREREAILKQIEERHRDPEAKEEESIEDQKTTFKATEAAPTRLPNNTTVCKQGGSDRNTEAFADAIKFSHTFSVTSPTPELDSLDQPDTGPEVKSTYFTPEKQKRKKTRFNDSVKNELLEPEIRTVRTYRELKKEAKEKHTKFRNELAEKLRISNAQTRMAPLLAIVDTPSHLRQPTPQVGETAEAVLRDEVRTTPQSHTMHWNHRQSESLVEAENNEAENVEKALISLERALDNSDLVEAARNEIVGISRTGGTQLADRASTNGVAIDESAGRNITAQSEQLPQVIANATIQPVMRESPIAHNGWIPINRTALAAKDQPGLKESCTVFGTIKKPNSSNPFIDLELATKGEGGKSTLGTDTPTSSQAKRLLRKRKSHPDVDEGAEEPVEVRSTMRPPNVKQEPLGFQSPMIQTTITTLTDIPASSYTGEGFSSKIENAVSKMDLAFIMLGGMEHQSEGQSASTENSQSSTLSRPGSEPTTLAWLLPEEHPAQVHEEKQGGEASTVLTHPSERGECNFPSTITSFVPPTMSEFCKIRQKPAKPLFGSLFPPTLHTPPMTPPQISRKNTAKASRFFPKSPVEKVSCIPFPPLDADSFGLVQERLCHEPFRLLIAVTFLNKTRGKVAIPVCYDLFERYPTPEDLANANPGELGFLIRGLGLQNQRGARMIKLAQLWVGKPPQKGKRYRRLHYPRKNDGKDVKHNEPISDDDPRVAWEIAYLPGAGAYALDSWRIFCRDELRGLPTGLPRNLCPEMVEKELRKEWTRVLPLDKELRAYLRWRWLRLGWNWNPVTGERHRVEPAFLNNLRGGGVSFEGDEHSTVEAVGSAMDTLKRGVRQGEQCEGSLLETWREDIVAMPVASGTVERSQGALATDERVAVVETIKGESGETDPLDVMNEDSVATTQSEDHPKAEPDLARNLDNGEQHLIEEGTGSETSPALKAALSWLHCEDIDDAQSTAQGTVAANQQSPTSKSQSREILVAQAILCCRFA